MKKIRSALALLVFTLCLACLMTTPAQAKIKLNKTSLSLMEGQSATLKITGTKKNVTWKSNRKSVATVTKKGKVTAVAPGAATISAKAAGKTRKCQVTVAVDYAKIYEYQIKYGKATINKLLRISDASLVIPETIEGCPVVELADGLFKNCDGLESVTLPSGVTAIGDSMFYGCKTLREVKGGAIRTLGAYAFYECPALTTLPDLSDLTAIGDYTFYNCGALAALPNLSNVSTVGDYAFYNCDALETLTFPAALKSIGAYAFYDCDKLVAFFGPGELSSMGDCAFKSCDALMLVNGNKNVQTIGAECFADCKHLVNISLGSRVTSFGAGCFSGCEALGQITLPATLTSIPDRCFYNCYALSNVTIPTAVTRIGNMAFFNCIRLTILTIPGTGITSIATDAFAGVPPTNLHIYYRASGASSYIESWAKGIGIAADHIHTIYTDEQ